MIKLNNIEYYDLLEAIDILKLKRRTIINYVYSKKLAAYRPSPRKYYFSKEQLENFIQGKNHGN